MGKSDVQIEPEDQRFVDPAWQGSAPYKRLLQAHTAYFSDRGRLFQSDRGR
jgi:hypothetical protein